MEYGKQLFSMIVVALTSLAISSANAAELKEATLNAWDNYLKQEDRSIEKRAADGECFFWADEDPARYKEVRAGSLLVQPIGEHNPLHVPSGLIHHWLGVVFIPGATPEDVFSVTRDYGQYNDYYKPGVADAKLISSSPLKDVFTIRFVNNSVLSKTSLVGMYTTDFVRLSEKKWYSVSATTQMREIRDFGEGNEKQLSPDQGSGYIWRLHSSGRLEQRDGGTLVEIEAIALSRDVPRSLRWFVDPIVRRISRESLEKSLTETKDAVRAHLEACAAQGHSQLQGDRIIVTSSCAHHSDLNPDLNNAANSDLRPKRLASNTRR